MTAPRTLLTLTLLTSGAAQAQPTVHIPNDATTLSEALRLVDDGGTILVAEGNETLIEDCVYVLKNVTIQGEGDHPTLTGISPQYVTLNLDNLTLAGTCYGSSSAGGGSSSLYAHMIAYGGVVTGTNLTLAPHDGVGVALSDATVSITGLSAEGLTGPVFNAEVYAAITALELRQAALLNNEGGLFAGLRLSSTDPALQIRVSDSELIGNRDSVASVLNIANGEVSFEGCTISGTGADGGGYPVSSSGLMYLYNSQLGIADTTISDCLGTYSGAILAQGLADDGQDNVNIADVTVRDCGAEIGSGYGGLLFAMDTNVTLTNVEATGVFATAGALVKHEFSGTLTVKDASVIGYRNEFGGAIYGNESDRISVTRVHLCDAETVYENNNTGVQTYLVGETIIHNLIAHGMDAPEGSIIKSTAGTLELRNSTFAGNAVHDIVITENDTLRLFNNIFTHSPGATGVTFWSTPTTWTGGYNLWYSLSVPVYGFDSLEDTTDVTLEPSFSPDWVESDCSTLPYLGAGSPAIDAGNPDPIFNDTDGTRSDMGALGGPEGDWTDPADTSTPELPIDEATEPGQLTGGLAGCATVDGTRSWWALLGLIALRRRRCR